MYICSYCGKTFEDEEVETVESEESIVVDGYSCRTFVLSSCTCGRELEKASICQKCGAPVEEGYSLCEICLEEYKTVDVALEIGEEWDGCITLNGFLLSYYSREDIEQILLDSIRNESVDKVQKAVSRYCEEDKECFRECAEKKWKEQR